MVKTYCTNCSKKCVGDVLKVGDRYFHQSCFKCKDCNSYLDTGGFFFRNDDYYCPKDYSIRFSNKCFICSDLIESEIVSALNNHFHKNCFKCNVCSKVFCPGDRVTMTTNSFMCSSCLCEAETDRGKLISTETRKAYDLSLNKEPISDDLITDQGYISGDPTSFSFLTPSDINAEDTKEPMKKTEKIARSRPNVYHRLFEFGKFYKSSYLDIQQTRNNERRSQSRSSADRTGHLSRNFHLPLKKNQRGKHQKEEILSSRSGMAVAIGTNLKHTASDNETDIAEKENTIRLASYPSGEKPLVNVSVPLERDDWPAPLSTAILLHEKMLRLRKSSENKTNTSGDNIVDYTQSLDHLPYNMPRRNLIEVLRDSPKHKVNKNHDDVISASRSPSANKQPMSKTRYSNHKDKSKSRDSTYFNDHQRHNGYSLEFVSSTTRPFLAGHVPYGLKPGYTEGLIHEIKNKSKEVSKTLNTNNNNKGGGEVSYTWVAVRTMSDTFDVQLKNVEYDSTLEETIFDNQEELSISEVDVVTGLKITKNRFLKDRNKDQNASSDKSSINSKIESLETWSFWSQKPLPLVKSFNVSYFDIVSKNPKVLKGLDINRLETYLSTEEFQQLFNLSRTEFYRLPEWKQNDLKRRVHLF